MVIALLALQVAGFVALYVLLRRAVMRRMSARNMVPELRSEVAALIAELNGTTERNVALLEDGIGRLQELLRSADRGAAAPGSPPDPGVPAVPAVSAVPIAPTAPTGPAGRPARPPSGARRCCACAASACPAPRLPIASQPARAKSS